MTYHFLRILDLSYSKVETSSNVWRIHKSWGYPSTKSDPKAEFPNGSFDFVERDSVLVLILHSVVERGASSFLAEREKFKGCLLWCGSSLFCDDWQVLFPVVENQKLLVKVVGGVMLEEFLHHGPTWVEYEELEGSSGMNWHRHVPAALSCLVITEFGVHEHYPVVHQISNQIVCVG